MPPHWAARFGRYRRPRGMAQSNLGGVSGLQPSTLGLLIGLGSRPINSLAQNHHARSSREANAVKAARLVDRGFAQHVRAIHPFAACRYLQRYRSRGFRASSRAFIEASAQPPQPFGNPRRLDRPISQHDAGLRLSLHPEGLNGNAEIKGS